MHIGVGRYETVLIFIVNEVVLNWIALCQSRKGATIATTRRHFQSGSKFHRCPRQIFAAAGGADMRGVFMEHRDGSRYAVRR